MKLKHEFLLWKLSHCGDKKEEGLSHIYVEEKKGFKRVRVEKMQVGQK
jgi:hypothetical protein